MSRKSKRRRSQKVKSPSAHYDAAKLTRRTSTWHAPGTGPNTEIGRDLRELRNRHRDLARNNPWARRAISAIVNNAVGPGIKAQWKDEGRKTRWQLWFEGKECDADGRHDGYGLQALALRTVVESGACLIRRRPRRPEDGLTVPLQIQLIEPDLIDLSKSEELPGGGFIVQGMEYDARGRWVAVWLYKTHPGEIFGFNFDSMRYSSRDFLYIARIDRPGQVHGVPWGTGAMMRLKMLDDYQDAQLERARLSACYAGFIRDIDGNGSPEKVESTIPDKLEPGTLEFLPDGKTIDFANPPHPEDDKEFRLGVLHAVGADYGVPYEILTGDLSEVNFSSARMGWNEFSRSIDFWRWGMLRPQLLEPIASWFLEAEKIAGFDAGEEEKEPLWTAPARVMVDPAREVKPVIDSVRAGLISQPEAIRKLGYDPVMLVQEQAAFLKMLDEIGITFDTDSRHKKSGPAQDKDDEVKVNE